MATEGAVPVVHEDDKKLFVGALPQEAKDSDIKEYFETYGEVENINLKMDPMTGRSRGFAFVVFKTVEGIEAALQQTAHVVKVVQKKNPDLFSFRFILGEKGNMQESRGSPRENLCWQTACRRSNIQGGYPGTF